MPDTATTSAREAEAQIAKFREDFQKLRQEFLDDDKIDKEEEDILKDVENMIAQVEAKIAEKKTETGDADSAAAAEDDDAGRDAWEARKGDYRALIVAADALQKEGNPNAPTLTKFLNRIDDAVAEDRWGEAVELLDLAQMTVQSATGSKDEDADPGRAKWDELSGDYDGVVNEINEQRADEHPDVERFEGFVTQMDRAVSEERWTDAIETLDLAQSSLGAAGFVPEGAGEGPEASEALAELAESEAQAEPSQDSAKATPSPETAKASDDDSEEEEEWLQMANQLDELQQLMQQLIGAGADVATGIVRGFTDILKASAERRWEDAVSLLTTTLATAREMTEEIGGGDTAAPHTTDPVVADDTGGSKNEDEEEWLQMAGQLDEFQQLMQQLLQAGHSAATGMTSLFSDILEARSESRWQDAIMLLTSALASARALAREIGGGDTPAANTTDPVVPGVTPDGPGGEEPVDPGGISPATASISGSVGKGGKNKAEDVTTVQQLLNQNGASPALEVDGAVGPKTNGAISKFQQANLGFQDGCVDPGGKTWGALTGGGGATPGEQSAGGGEAGAAAGAAAGGEAGDYEGMEIGPGGMVPDGEDRKPAGTYERYDREDDAGDDTPDLPTTPEDVDRRNRRRIDEQIPDETEVIIEDAEDGDVLDPEEHRFMQNQEISVSCPFGQIAIKFNEKGQIKEASLSAPIIQPVSVSVSAYAILGKLEAKPYSGALKLSKPGGNLRLELELSASGSGFMGIGVGKGDAWGGIGIEVEVKVARTDKVTAEMSLEMLKQIALGGAAAPIAKATFSLPAKIVLSGSQSVVIGGSAPKGIIGIASKMVFKEYNPMATLKISDAGGELSCDFETFEGLQQMAEDVARFQPQIDMIFRYYDLVRDIQRMRDDPEGFIEDYEKKIENYRRLLKEYEDDFAELVAEELAKLDALVLVFQALAEKAEEAYEDAKEYVEEKSEELYDGAKELYDDAEKAYDEAEEYLEKKAEEAEEYVDEKIDEAEEYIEKKAEEAEEYVDEKIDEAEEAYDDAKDAVEEKAEELWGDAVDYFSDDDDKD